MPVPGATLIASTVPMHEYVAHAGAANNKLATMVLASCNDRRRFMMEFLPGYGFKPTYVGTSADQDVGMFAQV